MEHIYTLSGTQIISEAWGTNLLIYLYDESGSPIGMQYRNDAYAADTFFTFFFEKNLQGDITAVYNENGVKVLSYTYDAWGNHTTTWHTGMGTDLFADYNPFRYRGYYYDTETGWYYLQSRYYNPKWGRFLNADGLISTGQGLLGYNMYAYCNNCPIMYVDHTGTDAIYVSTKEKLPVVGHALVYIQDEQGQWYKTQFEGDFYDKSSAIITIKPMSFSDIMYHLEQEKVDFVYLEGDYSEGARIAGQYSEGNTQYNGNYDLFTNNCTDYTQEILCYGPDKKTMRKQKKYIAPEAFWGALSIQYPAGTNRLPERYASMALPRNHNSKRLIDSVCW